VRRRGSRDGGLLTNPVLIGAFTVLVTIVAVTLAYNATNGLPFVPTYELHVQAADASELTHGDEVNMGGARVGFVSSVVPTRIAGGRPIAVINLKLYKSIEPLPVDSTFTVRLKGAIGLKYLQITLGHSHRGYQNQATVPLSRMHTEVDFDQVLSMFTPATRKGVAQSTIGFGQALAGRGGDINDAIHAFVPLLRDLEPVARNLASARTGLGGFFRGLNSYAGALAPVAAAQATLFANLDTTFTAFASVAVPSLQQTISLTPPLFEETIKDGPTLGPFLKDTAKLLGDFRPGAATLPSSAPVLADAFAAGVRNLPGTAALDRRTVALSQALANYSQNPSVQAGLDRVTLTLSSLGPPLAFLTPTQTTCNYVSLFLRNTASLLSEHVSQGTLLRFVQITIDDEPGFESEPSSTPYTGSSGNAHGALHVDPYPNTAAPGETQECSAGNEPFNANKAVFGNPPGNVGTGTEKTKAKAG
jgi:phospholipid/cholesterol/gamma-HCH transport system substrate-binding protein